MTEVIMSNFVAVLVHDDIMHASARVNVHKPSQ
jgi:hypothetical protein